MTASRCSSPTTCSHSASSPISQAVSGAATDALARSREAALDYAGKARSCLDNELHREELEALTYAVVDRAS